MDNKELASYIMEQLQGLSNIRNITMMGGYIFYYNEKIFGGIYNSEFMVKVTKSSVKYMQNAVCKPPYKGAKDMLVVNILEDDKLLKQMVVEMFDELPKRTIKKKKEVIL